MDNENLGNTIHTVMSSSPTYDDSLYAIYKTPMGNSVFNPRTTPNIGDHTLVDTDNIIGPLSQLINMVESFIEPITINQTKSFLDLPQSILVTPTYHIHQTPDSMKITQFFSPVRQKRKGRDGEGNEETISDTPPQTKPTIIKIFNLSSHLLSETERELLGKGLSFCPTSKIDEFNLYVDLNRFIQKLTLDRHFKIHPNYISNTIETTATNIISGAKAIPEPIHTELKPS